MQELLTESFYITGISTRTDNRPDKAGKDIPALWATFAASPVSGMIPDRVNDAVYSVYTNYESDHTGEYDVILGYRTPDMPLAVPRGLVTVRISAGPYERFTAAGNLRHGVVFDEWVKIWNAGLNRAFTADFEVYDERSADPSNASVDIYISTVTPSAGS